MFLCDIRPLTKIYVYYDVTVLLTSQDIHRNGDVNKRPTRRRRRDHVIKNGDSLKSEMHHIKRSPYCCQYPGLNWTLAKWQQWLRRWHNIETMDCRYLVGYGYGKWVCGTWVVILMVPLMSMFFSSPWSSGSVLDHRSLPPVFESRRGDIWRLFHLWLRFVTFGSRSAHLAYHVHKSGRKTSINHHLLNTSMGRVPDADLEIGVRFLPIAVF